jgi:hypothetical protein
MDYFRKDFPTNQFFFKDKKDFALCESDDNYKRKVYNTTLSLSYFACYHDEIKLIFGGPNKLLLMEDIAMNMELQELQEIFWNGLKDFKLKGKWNVFEPNLYIPDFINCLKIIIQEKYSEKLYDKKCQYTAAVFRKIHRIYNNNMLFMPNQLVERTYQHM